MHRTTSRYSKDATAPRLAIVIHAFYPDLFRELADYFDAFQMDFKVFVSAPTAKIDEIRAILKPKSYHYEIIEVENRGRDIAPFLKIMPQVINEQFPLVLKLHTKKSTPNINGEKWRQDTYDYLVHAEQLRRHIEYLRDHPDFGLIGPADYIIPMHTFWNINGTRVRQLATRMGVKTIYVNNDAFIAGTMFLARTAALEPLVNLGIALDDFETEQGQEDGTLAHAVERAFTYSAKAAGLKIFGADQADRIITNYERFGKLWVARFRRFLSWVPN